MRAETFHLELITPCFCGGAEPEQSAEIRAPSIRGQLRWWFRTLGGFQSLAPMPVATQEAMIFGAIAGEEGLAGRLLVRVSCAEIQSRVRDGQELGHPLFSDPAYLTFPIQSREKGGQKTTYAGRGVLPERSRFELMIQWRGEARLWPDLLALTVVFGNLGALGFRSRRAMGALAFQGPRSGLPPLAEALSRFRDRNALDLRTMSVSSAKEAITKLGGWLRQWRAHGRTGDHAANLRDHGKPPLNAGFQYAKGDHDLGYALPAARGKPAFRPALGLPIVQRIQGRTNNWEYGQGTTQQPKGRFASPILLRPHRDSSGRWHALVIFVDTHQWPDDPATGAPRSVFLNGQPRPVSRDLYEAMKADAPGFLKPFP